MLLHSKERGPHASGLAWLKTDGSHCLFKRSMRAHFDPLLDLLDAMPALCGKSRQWPVVTPMSRSLRPYPN